VSLKFEENNIYFKQFHRIKEAISNFDDDYEIEKFELTEDILNDMQIQIEEIIEKPSKD
jgi:hypothetical protein